MDSRSKLRAFLLLRYTLIVATAYLLLVEGRFAVVSPAAIVLVALALASNVAIAQLPPQMTESMRFASAVLVYDTVWITAALLLSGCFNAEFFYLYFFVLLLAAIGESLRLIALGACVVCAGYLLGHSATGGWGPLWSSPSLIRLPFLFSTAVFYGYLVERTRREGRRADDAEALAAQLTRALAELRILYGRAQEADRIKTEFLATVSHELGTPLTSLKGYVELLLDQSYGAVNVEQRQVLGRVQSASGILQHAISRMLDASRIECDEDALQCEEIEIDRVFDALRGDLAPTGEVALHWPRASDIPPLRTDAEKLRTVLRNLVENALKYTARGMVAVDVRWDRQADEVEIRVTDTGIGIPAIDRQGVFEAFRQGSNRQQARSGVGLGLYIVQRLVTRLGGEVRLVSELGAGSTFTVRIPRLLHRGAAVQAGPALPARAMA